MSKIIASAAIRGAHKIITRVEKKYKEVSVKVSAKAGELQDRLSIRLEVSKQEKGGEKK